MLSPPLLPPHAEITSETKSTTNVREVTGLCVIRADESADCFTCNKENCVTLFACRIENCVTLFLAICDVST